VQAVAGRRRAHRSRGQALLELALISPVVLLLVGGGIDLGRLFYAKITIADAAREGALWAAQHPNSWMQGCDASRAVGPTNDNQVTCHARNEAAAGLVTIRSADVTCSSTAAPTYTACTTNSPAEGGTVYVTVHGTFNTLMGGLSFNLEATAVGRVVQMPAPPPPASPQTITFGPLANQDVGVGSITVSATASSGLAVSFRTTTQSVCRESGADGSTISILTIGTCSVVADQPGDGHWAPAPSVTQSFQVTGPPPPTGSAQTISFPPISDQQLGTGPAHAAATASSGLTVSFTSTTPSVCSTFGTDGASITLLAAGMCTIQADQPGDATWSAAPPVLQSFNVIAPSPPPCAAPTLSFTITPTTGVDYKNAPHPGTTFVFDANASTSPQNCGAVWSWNFGNSAGTSSTPYQTTYVYPDPGPLPTRQFTVTLVVTVNGGVSSSTTRTVTVNPQ
jgi:Flp pilus assembly protein TadG